MPETQYTFRYADTDALARESFTETEWFAIFVSGTIRGRAILWIERSNDSAKRVTFAEHTDGEKSC